MKRTTQSKHEIYYILRRRGEFGILVRGDAHCSTKPSKAILKYSVIVECYKTDNRGFVYSQEDLAQFFEWTDQTSLSCESLAADLAQAIYGRIAQNIRSKRLRVTVGISPPPYVGSASAMIGSLRSGSNVSSESG